MYVENIEKKDTFLFAPCAPSLKIIVHKGLRELPRGSEIDQIHHLLVCGGS